MGKMLTLLKLKVTNIPEFHLTCDPTSPVGTENKSFVMIPRKEQHFAIYFNVSDTLSEKLHITT
jgi:hypothetical protein